MNGLWKWLHHFAIRLIRIWSAFCLCLWIVTAPARSLHSRCFVLCQEKKRKENEHTNRDYYFYSSLSRMTGAYILHIPLMVWIASSLFHGLLSVLTYYWEVHFDCLKNTNRYRIIFPFQRQFSLMNPTISKWAINLLIDICHNDRLAEVMRVNAVSIQVEMLIQSRDIPLTFLRNLHRAHMNWTYVGALVSIPNSTSSGSLIHFKLAIQHIRFLSSPFFLFVRF